MKLSSLSGGTLSSSLPCAIKVDYTDNDSAFKDVVFESVMVTYNDGTVDPSTETTKMPLRIRGRQYELVNSVGAGQIEFPIIATGQTELLW